MSVLAIARASALRVLRDRTALFFMFVLPVVLILVIGISVRGYSTFRVGVVDLGSGRTGASVVAALERSPDLVVQTFATEAAASKAVAREEVATAVVLPAGMDTAVRAGRTATVGVLAEQANTTQQAAVQAIGAVVASEGAKVQAAHFAVSHAQGTYDQNLALASGLQSQVPAVEVTSQQVGGRADVLPEGFSYSGPTMLVLFVFVSGVSGGASIVESRRLGMYERMATTPVRPAAVVAGETLSSLLVALGQSVLIVAVGIVVFGVSWGDPVAATVLVLVWAAVGAGAGMLAGTLFKTVEQATAIGPAAGLVLAMLGGCMWPLSIVSTTLREVGHATPQAWAVDAWTALMARGGNLSSIAGELAILVAFAAGFGALATVRLRRAVA